MPKTTEQHVFLLIVYTVRTAPADASRQPKQPHTTAAHWIPEKKNPIHFRRK